MTAAVAGLDRPRVGAAALCTINPPQWWDLGDPGNQQAIRLCGRCPLNGHACLDQFPGGKPRGVIADGRPYDERAGIIRTCNTCGHPRIHRARTDGGLRTCQCLAARLPANPTRPVDHHDTVMRMLTGPQPATFQQVADAIGSTRDAVKSYWRRHGKQQIGAAA